MEAEPAEPMSLQQLEAFLARAQEDPTLERPPPPLLVICMLTILFVQPVL